MANHDNDSKYAEYKVDGKAKNVPGPEEEVGEHCRDIAPLFKVGSHEGQVFGVTSRVRLAELVEVDTNPHGAAVHNDPDHQQYLPRIRTHVFLFLRLKIIAH